LKSLIRSNIGDAGVGLVSAGVLIYVNAKM
jgi:hypothetical protein